MKHVAISALGKDRPGIVAAITQVLFETGCNIEDSSMTLLASEFAMLLIVAVPASIAVTTLEKRLAAAGKKLALTIDVRQLQAREVTKEKQRGTPYIISVYGADRPGIVSKISKLLADTGTNITDVQTKIAGSKKKPLYIMLLEVELTGKKKLEKLQEELANLSELLTVSISMHPCETTQI
jgi:glycine cleavage system transcriptional repressor